MSQPKHKRRTKHRGNAAGMIETRGRPSHKPTAEQRKSRNASSGGGAKTRLLREPKPPSWSSAAKRALLIGVPVMVVLVLINHGKKHAPSVLAYVFLILALVVFYIPAMYYMDRMMYQRALRKQAAGQGGGDTQIGGRRERKR